MTTTNRINHHHQPAIHWRLVDLCNTLAVDALENRQPKRAKFFTAIAKKHISIANNRQWVEHYEAQLQQLR